MTSSSCVQTRCGRLDCSVGLLFFSESVTVFRARNYFKMASKVGKIVSKNSILFLCDMQEKFRPTIQYFPQIIEVSSRMLGGARALDMPVIVTEQYPKGK